jgi:hypothetical protein
MQTTAILLGAGAFGLVAGALGGSKIATQPISAADTDLLAGITQHQLADIAQAQNGPRPPDHYPLVTPEGTIPVEQLAFYGVMRDRGYADPYRYSYDPALGEDFAYSEDWNYYEDGPGAQQAAAAPPARVTVSASYDGPTAEPASQVAQDRPREVKLDDIPTVALPTEVEPIVPSIAELGPDEAIGLQ